MKRIIIFTLLLSILIFVWIWKDIFNKRFLEIRDYSKYRKILYSTKTSNNFRFYKELKKNGIKIYVREGEGVYVEERDVRKAEVILKRLNYIRDTNFKKMQVNE